MLEAAGLSVQQVVFDNADLPEARSVVGAFRNAAAAVWSRSAQRRILDAVRQHRAQVVHIHNTFVAASPSVYRAAFTQRVPVVQTIHNYRLFCPAGTAFRNHHPCLDCLTRTVPWPAVAHACYRSSRAQSAVAAAAVGVHRALGIFGHYIDLFLALTRFQRDLMVTAGLPAGRIRVVSNFLEPDPGVADREREGFLFVGRLAEEKGVPVVLAAAALEPGVLTLAGSGPLQALVEQAAESGHVVYVGELDRESVLEAMRRARAVVIPSVWFEGFPLVVLEAYATATPVIASRTGSLAEVVEDGVTGLLFDAGNPVALARLLRWAREHPEELRRMGVAARLVYEKQHRGATHLAALLDVYRTVLADKGTGTRQT